MEITCKLAVKLWTNLQGLDEIHFPTHDYFCRFLLHKAMRSLVYGTLVKNEEMHKLGDLGKWRQLRMGQLLVLNYSISCPSINCMSLFWEFHHPSEDRSLFWRVPRVCLVWKAVWKLYNMSAKHLNVGRLLEEINWLKQPPETGFSYLS